jgi:hypothetical protein
MVEGAWLAATHEKRLSCLHLFVGDRIFTYAILKTMEMVIDSL